MNFGERIAPALRCALNSASSLLVLFFVYIIECRKTDCHVASLFAMTGNPGHCEEALYIGPTRQSVLPIIDSDAESFHTILHLNHCISSREGPQKARECLVFRKPSPSGGRWMAHLWARRMREMIRIISFRSQIVSGKKATIHSLGLRPHQSALWAASFPQRGKPFAPSKHNVSFIGDSLQY